MMANLACSYGGYSMATGITGVQNETEVFFFSHDWKWNIYIQAFLCRVWRSQKPRAAKPPEHFYEISPQQKWNKRLRVWDDGLANTTYSYLPPSVHTKGGRFNQVRLNTSESEWVLRTVMLLLHIVILSAVCTALYHCLLTELPHICTANSVLLMKRAKKRLLTVPVNFSGYFFGPLSSVSVVPTPLNALLAGCNCSFHARLLSKGCSVA